MLAFFTKVAITVLLLMIASTANDDRPSGQVGANPNTTHNDEGWAFKALLIRGLCEAWRRSPSDSSIAKLIQSYITVQYNALLDFSRIPEGHFYSPIWRPPPASHLIPWGQVAAIDVMNSAIDLPVSADSEATTSSSIVSSTASSSPTSLAQTSSRASLNYPLVRTPIIDTIFGSLVDTLCAELSRARTMNLVSHRQT
ncbi:hypothetical protein K474DRAFT_1712804 [Panus rudis PR-1116 ss-1]|nr:hypothetical protein K474DRAFT_1712804 [Panus rudis PR-1116 ss-1]